MRNCSKKDYPQIFFGAQDADGLLRAFFSGKPLFLPGTKDSREWARAFNRVQLKNLLSPQEFMFLSVEKFISNQVINSARRPRIAEEITRPGNSTKSIMVPDFQFFDSNALWLSEVISRWFGCPTKMNLFITPPGEQTLPVHTDGHDVLVYQVSGTKNWSLYSNKLTGYSHFQGRVFPNPGRPQFQQALNPGNFLFLTKGTPHAAIATDRTSIHISIGLHPLSTKLFQSAVAGRVRIQKKFFETKRGVLLGGHQSSARRIRRGQIFLDLEAMGIPMQTDFLKNAYAKNLKLPSPPVGWRNKQKKISPDQVFLSQARHFNFYAATKGQTLMIGQGQEILLPGVFARPLEVLSDSFLVSAKDMKTVIPSSKNRNVFFDICRRTNLLLPLGTGFPAGRIQKMLDTVHLIA
ncbi:MAG: hypothetical protein K2X47_07625 [Bdellovibrionales bacterium]|nr:hypothetical protein [Bdellovibrionales bacterium]